LRKNEGRVYFAFDGTDFDPNEITKLLEIEPTKIKLKNELPSGKLPKFNSWIFSTNNISEEYIDIYDMATSIVQTLESKIDTINEIRKRFNVSTRLAVVLSFSTDEGISTPAIGFDASTVSFLAKVGAFIDIDTYLLPS
jgi:hypothetical protein